MTLISRLTGLFARKRDTVAPVRTPPATQQAPAEPTPASAPVLAEVTAPVVRDDPRREPPVDNAEAGLEDEDGDDAPEPDEDELQDPTLGSGEPLQISLPTAQTLAASRGEAERLALTGPQRVTLTDAAGPGSLAETLARLETDGRVTSEILDDPDTGPYILYRPR